MPQTMKEEIPPFCLSYILHRTPFYTGMDMKKGSLAVMNGGWDFAFVSVSLSLSLALEVTAL